MDFSKLNLEFANMQKTVEDYNKMITLINARIKDNLRTVSKYETKMKNKKNKLEKDLAHLYITSIKCETEFLESLVKEKNNERESGNTKNVVYEEEIKELDITMEM